MLDYADSALYKLLVAQGVAKRTAGTGSLGNEKAGGSYDSAAPQVLTEGRGGVALPPIGTRGETRIRLVWSQ